MGAAILAALLVIGRSDYLLFHCLAEIFSIVVACCIFVVAWNSRRFIENNYLLVLGVSYLFVAAIDLVHTLAYRGMGVFHGYSTNLATQLWIAARGMESISLLIAPLFLRRRISLVAIIGGYAVATGLLLLTVFTWRVFPVCFIEGAGLTPFKIVSEYVICAILVAAQLGLNRRREDFDVGVFRLITGSICLTIVSEICFTRYVSAYGGANMLGHIFKIVSFYLIYKALIETGFTRPFDLLFRDLKRHEVVLELARDQLEARIVERTSELVATNVHLLRESEERRRAEAELRTLNQELEQRVLLRTAELQEAITELDAFSYSVSHDLRAPLRAIGGFARLLSEQHGQHLSEDGRHCVARVSDNAEKMGQLIEALLALSHLGRQPLDTRRIDPAEIARDAFADLIAERGDRLVEMTIGDLPPCDGDPHLLKQVFVNLLSNALKFTRNRPAAVIEVGSRNEESGCVYFVRDNGVGFDAHRADRLFGVFQRYHRAEDYPGTGCGLAIVQRIVRRHGGCIWAEAEEGRGATFYFTLGSVLERENNGSDRKTTPPHETTNRLKDVC